VASYGDNNEDVAELEEIFAGGGLKKELFFAGGLFSLSNENLEFLPLAEDQVDDVNDEVPAKVIFEKDGIPYIDNDACNRNECTEKELDGKFASLVKAVVHNKGPS